MTHPSLRDPATLGEADVMCWLVEDPWHRRALELVASLDLPDAWIVAGFLRCRVWDLLHGHDQPTAPNDIDVVFFDPERPAIEDRKIEAQLRKLDESYPWEVYNQAHMHTFNRDLPYQGSIDSISRWAETVSTIGIRLRSQNSSEVQLAAPHGLEDLLRMVIRPTPHRDANRTIFVRRLLTKGWLIRWPKARLDLVPRS